MKTLWLNHPDCELHEMPGHVEQPARLKAVVDRIRASGLERELTSTSSEEVTDEQLQRVHTQSLVDRLTINSPASGLARIDADTFMSPHSLRAARLAAGAGAKATGMILAGEAKRAFCTVRPPGHHAEISEAMGFCLFNNIAVAVATALQSDGIERVAVLDFDVHHGNGTVDVFRQWPEVLVCSSFQDNFYPHRYLDYCNDHIIPTPLPAGTGSGEFRRAIERDWIPAIARHQPDIIMVSAGFDGHRLDPLGGFELTTEDYAWITRLICDMSNDYCEGRIVSMLEGGYDLAALADAAEAHLTALVEMP